MSESIVTSPNPASGELTTRKKRMPNIIDPSAMKKNIAVLREYTQGKNSEELQSFYEQLAINLAVQVPGLKFAQAIYTAEANLNAKHVEPKASAAKR